MQANVEIGESKKPFEEKQARLAKMGGLQLKIDFDQRISGWGRTENKAACFECGNTDRFNAKCPIWLKKKERWKKEGKTAKGKGKGKKKSVLFDCLDREEVGQET